MIKLGVILILLTCQFCHATSIMTPIDRIKIKVRLAELFAKDQTVRDEVQKILKNKNHASQAISYLRQVDLENNDQLLQMLHEVNYLSLLQLGKKYTHMVWLLAQHADFNLDFQMVSLRCFVCKSLEDKQALKYCAYLNDRILINLHLPQRYGTQGYCVGYHEWRPFNLQDETKVNQFRKRMGLNDYWLYKNRMNTFCL